MSTAEENKVTTGITPEDIHLPPNSYWPIVLAFGLVILISGFVFSIALTSIGVIITLTAAIGWVIEPGYEYPEDH